MEDKYEKIRALMDRRDFATAETLLDKYGAALDEAQTRSLRQALACKRREKDRAERRKVRHLRWGRYRRLIWPFQRRLGICWLVSGTILYPYRYFVSEGQFLGQPYAGSWGMEWLCLANHLCLALFCGMSLWEERGRVGRSGWGKLCLAGLAAAVLLIVLHIPRMVRLAPA